MLVRYPVQRKLRSFGFAELVESPDAAASFFYGGGHATWLSRREEVGHRVGHQSSSFPRQVIKFFHVLSSSCKFYAAEVPVFLLCCFCALRVCVLLVYKSTSFLFCCFLQVLLSPVFLFAVCISASVFFLYLHQVFVCICTVFFLHLRAWSPVVTAV